MHTSTSHHQNVCWIGVQFHECYYCTSSYILSPIFCFFILCNIMTISQHFIPLFNLSYINCPFCHSCAIFLSYKTTKGHTVVLLTMCTWKLNNHQSQVVLNLTLVLIWNRWRGNFFCRLKIINVVPICTQNFVIQLVQQLL